MRRNVLGTVLYGLLGACSVGNTGNPMSNDGPMSGKPPTGISLLRSELARDKDPAVSDAERTQLGVDQRAFSFALFDALSADNPNLFYSPYSIATALSMVYAGAEGETQTEMAQALSFSLPEPALHAAFNATDLALDGRASETKPGDGGDGFELSTINANFAQQGLMVQPAFLDVLARHYDAGLYLVDFAEDAERERLAINKWVREQTHDRVDELLPPMSLDPNTAMVLVNAIYFKASWLQKFDPAMTTDAPFHGADGDVSVPMMRNTGRRGYAKGEGYQAVELSYVSEAVRMLLILPDAGQQSAVEARLKSGLFDEIRAGLEQTSVALSLPRFSFHSDLDLKPALETLGMKRAFGPADFSGIAGSPGEIFIGGVFHQAFIAVDEKGTEAAAATAVVLVQRNQPAAVSFDRPFLFAVYDQPTGHILFVGRLSNP